MTMTVAHLLEFGKEALASQGLPMLESQLLLACVLHCDRIKLYTWHQKEVSDPEIKAFKQLVERRQHHEPMAYILGYKEFWSLVFKVTPDTLIPRSDTELLVETLLSHLPEGKQKVLDLGTGCGAIACALAHSRPEWGITATDVSEKALNVAKENAEQLGLSQIEFIQSDWFQSIHHQSFDAIVSNPPYIREYDLHLMHGDLLYEPRLALTPGASGLDAFHLIVQQSKGYLKPQGLLALEHGFDQANSVQTILTQAGFLEIQTYRDLSGLERVTTGKNA